MADRYLLESGSPDGYLLEDGSGVLLLETPDFNEAYFACILQLVESFRNVRDRSLHQDGERKAVQGSGLGGPADSVDFSWHTHEEITRVFSQRAKLSVDHQTFSDANWMALAVENIYDALTMSGWMQPLGNFRSLSSLRYQRDTNTDIAWAAIIPEQLVSTAATSQLSESFRNVRDRSLYQDLEKRAVQGSSYSGTQIPEYDPQINNWTIPSDRVPKRQYWNSRGPSVDWIYAVTPVFDPATVPWNIPSHFPKKTRPAQISWTKSGFFVSLFFNPAQEGWTIDSQLVPGRPWWTGPNINVDWLPPEIIAEATFDTRQRNNAIDSQRVPSKPYWTTLWHGNDWITPGLLAELAHDPQYEDWTIKTNTYKSRAWWTDSPMQQAWLIPAVIFDPPLFPATAIPSHRELPKAKGLWQPDLDNAWQFENPVVPNIFNASFVTSANIVEDAGGSPERSS